MTVDFYHQLLHGESSFSPARASAGQALNLQVWPQQGGEDIKQQETDRK